MSRRIDLGSAALAASLAFALAAGPAAGQSASKTYTLEVTPQTVAWGNYDAAAKPVLSIQSGDTVVVHTLLTNSPTGLERNGVPPDQVEKSLRDVYANVPASARGPGGHILTGPIEILAGSPTRGAARSGVAERDRRRRPAGDRAARPAGGGARLRVRLAPGPPAAAGSVR